MNSSHIFGQKILCIRLDNMGDVLLCTPAMKAIKDSIPESTVTMLVSSTAATIVPLIGVVDSFIIYDAPWMKQTPQNPNPDETRNAIFSLKSFHFDSAIIFTSYSQNPLPAALLCYLAGIPVRIAYCRENPYGLLTYWEKEEEPENYIRHEVKRQLDLVRSYGCVTSDQSLQLSVKKSSVDQIQGIIEKLEKKWFILHAGCSAQSRCYDLHRFSQIIKMMNHNGWQIILTGNSKEIDQIEDLNALSGNICLNLCGKLSIEELSALITKAPFLVSNNTGPVHIASAVNTPVVVLYALTNPQHTPWKVPCCVLFKETNCAFCYKSICQQKHHHCLDLVSPEEVITAIDNLLVDCSKVSIR